MPPLASLFIELPGWRTAYLVLGVLAVVVGAGMSLLIENDPRDRGLGPDSDPLQAGVDATLPAGVSGIAAVRTRQFVSLYAACLICSFGAFVRFVHLVPYALDHGVAQSSAVLLLRAIGVGSTAGRFFLGGLADWMGRRSSLLAMFVGMALGLPIWACSTDFWPLAVFAFAYGVFYGGWVAVLPAVVMDYFGRRNVSGIIGVLHTSVAFGTLVGPAPLDSPSISTTATRCRSSLASARISSPQAYWRPHQESDSNVTRVAVTSKDYAVRLSLASSSKLKSDAV